MIETDNRMKIKYRYQNSAKMSLLKEKDFRKENQRKENQRKEKLRLPGMKRTRFAIKMKEM